MSEKNAIPGTVTPTIVRLEGDWRQLADRLAISEVERRVIYRPPQEPGFVAWCSAWREATGRLKVCLTEVVGDLDSWPPSYDFTSNRSRNRLITLESADGGVSWRDTGFRADADPHNTENSDHSFRHIVELPDGRLLRAGAIRDPRKVKKTEHQVYDPRLAAETTTFPFVSQALTVASPAACIYESLDCGASWKLIYRSDDPDLYISGFHRLRSGLLVATGALRSAPLPDGYRGALIESADDGRSWSRPWIFAENNSVIRGLCEESDFAELDDGRLLLIQRVVGADGRDVQIYLKRHAGGGWETAPATVPSGFVRTGYPFVTRTTDGVLFFETGGALLYSCDDGRSWSALKLIYTYYGQLQEAAPGRMLSLSQNNIGDSPFPWHYDASVIQCAFRYRRIAVWSVANGGSARIGAEPMENFHFYTMLQGVEPLGMSWQTESGTGFYAVLEPRPDRAAAGKYHYFWKLGRIESGVRKVRRECYAGSAAAAVAEIQLDMHEGLLRGALKINEGDWSTGQNPPVYLCMRIAAGERGRLAVFATGAAEFRDLRLSGVGGVALRDQWANADHSNVTVTLDAGRGDSAGCAR